MIYLGKLTVENFGSIEHIVYDFNKVGLNTIQGLNGAGKTSIFNALTWVIFKQLLKKNCSIEPWPQYIGKDYKGTKVELQLWDDNNQYKIIRCQEYTGKVLGKSGKNRLVFLINDKEVSQKGKVSIQQEINKTIGYTFDLFKSSVVFGQKMKRFIEEDGPAKKKIFDEAFESAFIGRAKELVQKRMEQKNIDHGKLVIKAQSCEKVFTIQKANLNDLKAILKTFKKNKKAKILKLTQESADLQKSIKIWEAQTQNKNLPTLLRAVEANRDKLVKKLQELSSEEFDISLRINRVESESEEIDEKIKALKEELTKIPKKCKSCGTPIPSNKRLTYKKEISQKIKGKQVEKEAVLRMVDSLLKKQNSMQIGIELLHNKLAKKKEKLGKLAKEHLEAENIKSKIKTNWALYYDKQTQIEQARKEKAPVKNLKETKGMLRSTREEWAKINSEIRVISKDLEVDKWLLQDPLSNSGLKAYIFDSMLTKTNLYLKSYKSLIGFEIKINVDLKSARKDIGISISKNGDEIPYEDLSGGQGQLAGVVVLFSLSDVVNASKPINILLMDEVFESLDKNNIPIVESIIQTKARNKAIHLITHNDNFNPVGSRKTLLELVNGRTKIVSGYSN